MNSNQHMDDFSGRHHQEEWNDEAFNWDHMKDGIFEKVLQEDPQFFDKKRKRRWVVWFWMGAAILVGSGTGWWLSGDHQHQPGNPGTSPIGQAEHTVPVAKAPVQAQRAEYEIAATGKHARGLTPPAEAIALSLQHQSATIPAQIQPAIAVKSEEETTITTVIGLNNTISPLPVLPTVKPILIAPDFRYPGIKTVTTAPPQDTLNDQQPDKKPWKIAVTIGAPLSFSRYSGSSAAVSLRNNHTSAFFGYGYGIDAWLPAGKKNSFIVGLNRQVFFQNIDIYTEREVEIEYKNVLLEVVHNVVDNTNTEIYGDTIVKGLEKNRLVHYNEYRSTQLQLGFARSLDLKKWRLSPYAGMTTGLFTQTTGWTVAEDKSIIAFSKQQPILHQFRLSSFAGIEMEREVTKNISLLFRYSLEQQWNQASKEAGMALKPSTHYFAAGVAYRLPQQNR